MLPKTDSAYPRIYKQMHDDTKLAIIGRLIEEKNDTYLNDTFALLRTVTDKHKDISFSVINDTTFSFADDNDVKLNISYEEGVVIYNITKEEAIQLGKDAKQKTIVWKDTDIIYYIDIDNMTSFKFNRLTGVYKTIKHKRKDRPL